MGTIWWVYGIGLKGNPPAWNGKEVIGGSLDERRQRRRARGGHPAAPRPIDRGRRLEAAWPTTTRPSGRTPPRPTTSSRTRREVFKAGEYKAVAVYDEGRASAARRSATTLDFFAFFHQPHYALVEVQPVIPSPCRSPGGRRRRRSSTRASRPTYVLMERDLGTQRLPVGDRSPSAPACIFALCCCTLHRRDQTLRANVERGQGRRPGTGFGLKPTMGQYLPIVCSAGAGHRLRRAQLPGVEAPRAAAAERGEGGARTSAASCPAGSRPSASR